MKKEYKKNKTIYWKDEHNDDFNEIGLSRPSVPKDYPYIRKNPINNFFSGILLFGVAIPLIGLFCLCHGIKIKNKKNLKEVYKRGAIIYANHVAISDVFKYQARVIPFKRVNVIGYSDSLSMPIVKHLCRALGYLPLPLKEDKENFHRLVEAITYYVNNKHQFLLIFPEAHIWPYYTKIRNYPENSFYYPSLLQAPVLPMVTTWKKVWYKRKPIQIVNIGKAIYPIENESITYNKTYLHKECISQMNKISESTPQFEYIKYIKEE